VRFNLTRAQVLRNEQAFESAVSGCLDFNAMLEASCCRYPSMDSLAPASRGAFCFGPPL
jgi:hypothetical protein